MTTPSSTGFRVPPSRIWNLCMLAHVDHGKSALSDSLIAANGIISSRSAGKVRYMDSREDEQQRGITMKSSSIALGHRLSENDPLNIVNLVDSPGHVDFSGEVEAALRICDGAFLVVDVVEGVCVQTVAVLRAAIEHAVRPVLVLNKIDRLFGELHLGPMEAYHQIMNILRQVNVIMGVKQVEDMMAVASLADVEREEDSEWTLEDKPQSSTESGYFSPEQGNVVFASALDGWAFRIIDFARLFSKKFGISEKVLNTTLWGDYFWQPKTKKIVRKKSSELKTTSKPMFVQFILSNLHSIYTSVLSTQHDLELAIATRQKFVDKLGLKVTGRDLRHRDANNALHAIMNAWLPAASCLMDTVIEKLPSAAVAQADIARLRALWPNVDRVQKASEPGKELEKTMVKSFQRQLESLRAAKDDGEAPVIAVVSKMIEGSEDHGAGAAMNIRTPKSREELDAGKAEVSRQGAGNDEASGSATSPMIAFARILSGTLSVGDTVFVYSPKYQVAMDGSYDSSCVSSATITGLHLLMGRGTDHLRSASAGTILGITGLDEVVMKTATISSEPPGHCLPASAVLSHTLGLDRDAVVKVAVEPHLPKDVGKLREGLRRLNQVDPAVDTFITTKGEHVVAANGELHLERCLKDLRGRFAKGITIHVSKPIVSFRETVCGGISANVEAPSAAGTMVKPMAVTNGQDNSADSSSGKELSANRDGIWGQEAHTGWTVNVVSGTKPVAEFDSAFVKHGRVIRVGNDTMFLEITAMELPRQLASILEDSASVLRQADTDRSANVDEEIIEKLRESLMQAVDEYAKEQATRKQTSEKIKTYWLEKILPRVWSSGPRQFGPNLLIGPYESMAKSEILSKLFGKYSEPGDRINRSQIELEKAAIAGFQLATRAGPLCEEPLHGVAFIIDTVRIPESGAIEEEALPSLNVNENDSLDETVFEENNEAASTRSKVSGLMIGSMKEAVRVALMHGNARLMEGMLKVDISVPGEALGKTYTVLGQRRGRVLNEDMKEGINVFGIEALLPVQDSFGFTDALRKQTSGFAAPQMVLSHWEVIDIDPFWFPRTEEELEGLGAADMTAENNNHARKLINEVRRRKGLRVEEKIVESAEKQRTLSRKK